MRLLTYEVSKESRTAPMTAPLDTRGTATYSKSRPRVFEKRVPFASLPPRAFMNSGLSAKDRLLVLPGNGDESATRAPARPTTTTRPPTLNA